MLRKHLITPPPLEPRHRLQTLVENRSVHNLRNCELNLFETHRYAEHVGLRFNDLVVTAMLRGKKIMRVGGQNPFEYLPGETVLVPPGEQMLIDFPEASDHQPTQCLALALDGSRIDELLLHLNEHYPKEDGVWQLNLSDFFLYNSQELVQTLERLLSVCHQKGPVQDALADAAILELIVYLIQQQTRRRLQQSGQSDNLITEITAYLKDNLQQPIALDQLPNLTHMSSSKLYRLFKREIGMSPGAYLQQQRLAHAKDLLGHTTLAVREIAFESGFEDVPHFQRLFKRELGMSPGEYRRRFWSQP